MITPPGNGEETPIDRTEGGSPSEETPIYFTAPPRCGQCTSPPGWISCRTETSPPTRCRGHRQSAAKRQGSVDELGDCQPHHWGKAIYFGTTAPAVETDFDVLDYLLKKAKEMGFYTMSGMMFLTLPGRAVSPRPGGGQSDGQPAGGFHQRW